GWSVPAEEIAPGEVRSMRFGSVDVVVLRDRRGRCTRCAIRACTRCSAKDGTVLVLQPEVTPERSDEAADAVASCPVAALRLIGQYTRPRRRGAPLRLAHPRQRASSCVTDQRTPGPEPWNKSSAWCEDGHARAQRESSCLSHAEADPVGSVSA
ncbi:MAG: hypothetical protein ACREQ5_37925, partial [Candidatus Dormibacteria bacterium]